MHVRFFIISTSTNVVIVIIISAFNIIPIPSPKATVMCRAWIPQSRLHGFGVEGSWILGLANLDTYLGRCL